MKSAKQNTIQQSIDRHRIALIESEQRFPTTLCLFCCFVFSLFLVSGFLLLLLLLLLLVCCCLFVCCCCCCLFYFVSFHFKSIKSKRLRPQWIFFFRVFPACRCWLWEVVQVNGSTKARYASFWWLWEVVQVNGSTKAKYASFWWLWEVVQVNGSTKARYASFWWLWEVVQVNGSTKAKYASFC